MIKIFLILVTLLLFATSANADIAHTKFEICCFLIGKFSIFLLLFIIYAGISIREKIKNDEHQDN